MGLKVDKNDLKVKNKIVDDAIVHLKKEFIGIDEQIDTIMNNVRVWYLYPELQSRPCIVNIFGMTGCGKSSLVHRIAQLLDLEKNYVYFNFCAINEMSSMEIEDNIEDELGNGCSNRIFVFDEFQYAGILTSDGMEKDNKNGLKPFWELLDTGIIHKRTLYDDIRTLSRCVSYMMRINAVCPMEIIDGSWVNAEECLVSFNSYDRREIEDIFNFRRGGKESVRLDEVKAATKSKSNEDNVFFLDYYTLKKIARFCRQVYGWVCDDVDICDKLRGMNSTEICEWLASLCKKLMRGYDLNFSNSIVFVIANVDEAYDVAFDLNPDMSPDQFHAITKKISIVDIKKALQKRFRNEQIARLGNTYVIYPSFTSKSFKDLIDLYLGKYAKDIKDLCGLNIEFDESIKKVIFDEAVFPTQGTRPIFSTIYEIVKTKLPYIVRNICNNDKENDAKLIKYGYKGKKCVITILGDNDEVIDIYEFTDKLHLRGLRETVINEQQANTAVHESGHFVVYSYLNGKVPEKIISRSAEKDIDGFMMRNSDDDEYTIGSRLDYMNEIKIGLGGYVAEGILFGKDKRSAGSSNDLRKATEIASKMVRVWGMDDIPYITTHLMRGDNDGMYIKDDNQDYINDKIKNILQEALTETESIINKPHILEMLKKSSKYLLVHSQMPKSVMKKLLENAKKNGDICSNEETYYRDIVNKF